MALESTVITHGLPYPHNLALAREMEATVRRHGATPKTIAILGGELIAGLSDVQMEQLAHSSDVRKVSRRDLPIVTARAAGWLNHRGNDYVDRTAQRD